MAVGAVATGGQACVPARHAVALLLPGHPVGGRGGGGGHMAVAAARGGRVLLHLLLLLLLDLLPAAAAHLTPALLQSRAAAVLTVRLGIGLEAEAVAVVDARCVGHDERWLNWRAASSYRYVWVGGGAGIQSCFSHFTDTGA